MAGQVFLAVHDTCFLGQVLCLLLGAPCIPFWGAVHMPTDPLLESNRLSFCGSRLQGFPLPGEVCVVNTLLCLCFNSQTGNISEAKASTHAHWPPALLTALPATVPGETGKEHQIQKTSDRNRSGQLRGSRGTKSGGRLAISGQIHIHLPPFAVTPRLSTRSAGTGWRSLASTGTVPAVDVTHPSITINGRALIKCLAQLWFSSLTSPGCVDFWCWWGQVSTWSLVCVTYSSPLPFHSGRWWQQAGSPPGN